MFIPLVQKLLDDIIIRNEFSANEHPHILAGLQSSLTHEFNEFLKDNMRKQLQSIYKDVQNMQGIPLREEVERVTCYNHCDLNPTEIIAQYDQQSDESYQEQVFAINVFKSTIDKYINPPSIDATSMTHTKGVIIHGSWYGQDIHCQVGCSVHYMQWYEDCIYFYSWYPCIRSRRHSFAQSILLDTIET